VTWDLALGCLAAGLVIAALTTPVGVSGAVFLLPVQVSLLGAPSPAVTPTNLSSTSSQPQAACCATAAGADLTKDLVNDARDRCGGVDYNAVLRNVIFRLMQLRNEFPFHWLSTAPLIVRSLVNLLYLHAKCGARVRSLPSVHRFRDRLDKPIRDRHEWHGSRAAAIHCTPKFCRCRKGLQSDSF
jgi:hypothetical protein